jgi:hypothetical protein
VGWAYVRLDLCASDSTSPGSRSVNRLPLAWPWLADQQTACRHVHAKLRRGCQWPDHGLDVTSALLRQELQIPFNLHEVGWERDPVKSVFVVNSIGTEASVVTNLYHRIRFQLDAPRLYVF